MPKYSSLGCLAFLIAFIWGDVIHARVPDGLSHQLKLRHFNVYTTPCPANPMVLRDMNGSIVDLQALSGKVVLLNFWRIDCQPCMFEKPILERIRRKYGHRGLEVVAVNLFDDHNRIRSFCQGTGFGLKICCDSDNRISVRKQTLAGGKETTFVLNSRSEAIYEVPALPTTYVIDRRGWVVGNAVGMVSWEEEPFRHLLEYLLGPQSERMFQVVPAFADAAQQGQTFNPPPRPAGPRRESPAQQSTASPSLPSDAPSQPAPVQRSPLVEQDPAAGHQSVAQPPRDERRKDQQAPSRRTQQTQAPRATVAKQKPRQATQPEEQFRTPKTFVPTGATPGTAVPSLPTPTPYTGPTGATPPVVQPGAIGASRAPLPVALPYTRPRLEGAPRTGSGAVVPDVNGTVTARIPPRGEPGTPTGSGPVEPKAGSYSPGTGSARGTNPIDNFILDSFRKGGTPEQSKPESLRTTQTEAGAPQPADSVIEQVGRDFRNLGVGISEAFSRIWPGKR